MLADKDILTMTVSEFKNAVARQRAAEIRRNSDGNNVKVIRMVLDLTTARTAQNPYRIKTPFTALRVETATDSSTFVNISFGSDSVLQTDNYCKLIINDSMNLDDTINEANLVWTAQSGKSITLLFFLDTHFQSGSQLSLTAGGISVSEGSAFSTAVVSLTAATATQIFASNTSRKVSQFYNDSGASIWVGGATVTNSSTTKGFEILPGEKFFWRNTAALYGYHVAGYASLATLEET